MIKNKAIILPFLFLAWTIIFAHSVVPHHHHSHEVTECKHSRSEHEHNHYQVSDLSEKLNCDHNCDDGVCHFQVEVFTQVSLDHVFIVSNESSIYNDINSIETISFIFYKEFISDAIPKTNHLRGPPQIS